MIIDILKDAILANIGPLQTAPKGWQKSNCKLCYTQGHGKDTRNRFGIQFNHGTRSILTNCFNCGFSASYTEGKELSKSFKFFLSHLQINDKFIEQIEFEIFKQRNNITCVRDGDELPIESLESRFQSLFHTWTPHPLPSDSYSISEWLDNSCDDPDFLRVAMYATDRNLTDFSKFYWSPSTSHNIHQRLIIPYVYKTTNVGFTARLCYNVPDKSIPKYYQFCPQDFVYNLDDQSAWQRKYTIVTEGVLDAWTVDGVSVLGEVGQMKVDIINRLQKQIIVCPDRDKKGRDLVDIAIENEWAVSFPKWDNSIKDAAQAAEKYGRLLTTHSIISSAVSGKDKIKLKWQIEANERARRK